MLDDARGSLRSFVEGPKPTQGPARRVLESRTLWQELKAGRWRAEQSYCDAHRHYLVIREQRADPEGDRERGGAAFAALPALAALEQVLLGTAQKCLQMDLGVARSTISMRSKRGLESAGFECCAFKAPLLLAVLVHADRYALTAPTLQLSPLSLGERSATVSLARPELRLGNMLSTAELDVVRGLAEGESHRAMALRRCTSERTIANQVSSAFRRLKVSGRPELLSLLVRVALEPQLSSSRHVRVEIEPERLGDGKVGHGALVDVDGAR